MFGGGGMEDGCFVNCGFVEEGRHGQIAGPDGGAAICL